MIFGKKQSLSDKMKNEAVSLGLCAQWTAEWSDNTTKDDMVSKFVRGIDFCIARNWPSTKVMKKYFGDVIHNHGVYVDENVDLENPRIVILNGESVANIFYTGFGVGEIYVRHNCTLNLVVEGLAHVTVNVLDDAVLNVKCEQDAKCFVYQYGGSVKSKGYAHIRDRHGFEFK